MGTVCTAPARATFSTTRLAITVLIVLIAAGGAFWFGLNSVRPKEVPALWALGMDKPSTNRLDSQFQDADGNVNGCSLKS
jgi:hypothetical protein